jgi:hypothetical protein
MGSSSWVTEKHCRECGSPISGNYCSQCGQSTGTARLQYVQMVKEAMSSFFEDGSPTWRTVAGLFRAPHRVVSEYVEGKRRTYLGPIRYCMFTAAIYVVVSHLLFPDGIPLPQETLESYEKMGIKDEMQTVGNFMQRYTQILNLFLLPILAGLFRLMFRQSGRNFSEQLAFAAFLMGQISLAFIVLVPTGMLTHQLFGPLFSLVLPCLYYAWGARGFNGVRKRSALVRATLAYMGFMMITTIMMFSGTLILLMLGD